MVTGIKAKSDGRLIPRLSYHRTLVTSKLSLCGDLVPKFQEGKEIYIENWLNAAAKACNALNGALKSK